MPDPARPDRPARIEIGGIARAHGILGEVVVFTHDPDSETLGDVETCFVGGVERKIVKARNTHKGWLVGFEGVGSRNDAELLKGKPVEVLRSQLALEEDDILLSDMIGCTVQRPDGSSWGTIAEIETGAFQDLLVIHDGEIERLLPLVDEFVISVDIAAKLVRIDPPEGLPESKLLKR
jgi:16S rRNA processing protein RimM